MTSIQPSITMQASPVRHTDKERLTWERELLGLYISAHPLDNYDAYFEEQTIPLARMKPELDGKKAVIGGLVSAVRTIITKSGTKMAFLKIEDKTSEGEIVIFPNLFEQVGAKLIQDEVVRISGKINARDKEGNSLDTASMIADELVVVTDEELRTYESTGRKMEAPKASASRVRASRVKATPTKTGPSFSTPASSLPKEKAEARPIALENPVLRTVYVHIKDPNDQSILLQLKQTCSLHPGLSDIILVLGEDKKSAIRLPFRVETSDALVGALVKLLGEDCVVFK